MSSSTAKFLLLLGLQLGRAQSGGEPLLPLRGDGASAMDPFLTPGQLLDQSLGLTPGMTPCSDPSDPTSLIDQLLEAILNNGQDNSALNLMNNPAMSDLLAMILTLAAQADQQLNQLGQLCPGLGSGLGNPFMAGGCPTYNPFGNPGYGLWGNEDGGCNSYSSFMGFAAQFSGGCLMPGAQFGYGGSCASSMFFGMDAEFGYGCGDGGSYYVGGGGTRGHARGRGGCCIGEASMDASFCYSACSYEESCEASCEEDDDECSMELEMGCDYEECCIDEREEDDCEEEYEEECDDSCEASMCFEISCEISCESSCDDEC